MEGLYSLQKTMVKLILCSVLLTTDSRTEGKSSDPAKKTPHISLDYPKESFGTHPLHNLCRTVGICHQCYLSRKLGGLIEHRSTDNQRNNQPLLSPTPCCSDSKSYFMFHPSYNSRGYCANKDADTDEGTPP